MRLAVSKYAEQAFNNDFGKLATLSTGFLLFLLLLILIVILISALRFLHVLTLWCDVRGVRV